MLLPPPARATDAGCHPSANAGRQCRIATRFRRATATPQRLILLDEKHNSNCTYITSTQQWLQSDVTALYHCQVCLHLAFAFSSLPLPRLLSKVCGAHVLHPYHLPSSFQSVPHRTLSTRRLEILAAQHINASYHKEFGASSYFQQRLLRVPRRAPVIGYGISLAREQISGELPSGGGMMIILKAWLILLPPSTLISSTRAKRTTFLPTLSRPCAWCSFLHRSDLSIRTACAHYATF